MSAGCPWVNVGTAPLPTLSSVAAGTPVTWLATLAGSSEPVTEESPAPADGEPWVSLTTTNARTITRTTSVLPPVMIIRLRRSALRAASRCAAIFSRALCCLILLALPIACPHERVHKNPPAALHRRA